MAATRCSLLAIVAFGFMSALAGLGVLVSDGSAVADPPQAATRSLAPDPGEFASVR